MLLKNRESSYPLWLSMLLLLLSGCSSSDQPELPESPISTDIPVNFSAYSNWDDDSQTKVIDENNATSFENGDCMGIFAYYNDSSIPDFMNNQAVTYDGSSWNYSPIKYWPAQGTLSFYGYWPHNNQSITITSVSSEQISIDYNNNKSNIDLLVTSKQNINCPSKEAVPLSFKHLLSKVNFAFSYKQDTYRPTIHTIQFEGIPYKASLTYNYTSDQVDWDIDTETAQYKRFTTDASGVVIHTQKQIIPEFTAYLLPCTLNSSFLISINNVIYTYTPTSAITIESGKQYTLNFTISHKSESSSYFITSYSLWEDGEEYSGNLQ